MAPVILCERFAAIGFPRVEATSCLNPNVVPQIADAGDLLRSSSRASGVFYKAARANPRAVQRVLADLDAGLDFDRLPATAEYREQALGRELHGRVTRSGLNPLR